MKKVFLLLATLFVVDFIVIHYFLNGQFTIINLFVISGISGIFGFVFSKYGIKPKEK